MNSIQFKGSFFSPSLTATIIGGKGKMGQLFARLLQAVGAQVFLVDLESTEVNGSEELFFKSGSEESIHAVAKSDWVVFSLPMRALSESIAFYAPKAKQGALVLDTASLKEQFVLDLLHHTPEGVEVVGTHPLFGPYPNVKGQTMVICPVRLDNWKDSLREFLHFHDLRVLDASAKQHDMQVAISQSLLHATLFSFMSVVKSSGQQMEDINPFATPLYRLFSEMGARLLKQSSELYAFIALGNADSLRVMKDFRAQLDKFIDLVERADMKGYQASIEKLKPVFKNLDEAVKNSERWVENKQESPDGRLGG